MTVMQSCKIINENDKQNKRWQHAKTGDKTKKMINGAEFGTRQWGLTQTSDVSDVGLLIEAEEKGLCLGSVEAGVGVGVFRWSSIRFISIGGRTAIPPTGLKAFVLGLVSLGGVVGEVTADEVNAAEWRAFEFADGMASIEAVVPPMPRLFFGERSKVEVS